MDYKTANVTDASCITNAVWCFNLTIVFSTVVSLDISMLSIGIEQKTTDDVIRQSPTDRFKNEILLCSVFLFSICVNQGGLFYFFLNHPKYSLCRCNRIVNTHFLTVALANGFCVIVNMDADADAEFDIWYLSPFVEKRENSTMKYDAMISLIRIRSLFVWSHVCATLLCDIAKKREENASKRNSIHSPVWYRGERIITVMLLGLMLSVWATANTKTLIVPKNLSMHNPSNNQKPDERERESNEKNWKINE